MRNDKFPKEAVNPPQRKASGWIYGTIWLALAFPSAMAQTNFTLVTSFTGNVFGEHSARIPNSGLIWSSDGALFGATAGGGISNRGTVFRLNADGSGLEILKSFVNSEGAMPVGALTEGRDGTLYGRTFSSGLSSFGTIFKLDKNGANFSVVHHFLGGASDGQYSVGALALGTNDALFGMTQSGGVSNLGVIFRFNSDGSGYSVLHPFVPATGTFPGGSLIGSGGVLYGTANAHGPSEGGVVFKMTEDGTYTVLHAFQTDTGEGYSPQAGLLEASDHFFYGTTEGGGANGAGTVFRIDRNGGNYATLFSFDAPNNTNSGPRFQFELVEGDDGALYGATSSGGITNRGTCFKLNKDGSGFLVLRKFLGSGGDGRVPEGPLLKGSNGAFYGTTLAGGEFNQGCVFALSSAPLPSRVLGIVRSGSSNVVQFSATSSFLYDVQRSTNLTSWTVLATVAAPFIGRFDYTDTSPPASAAFYRLKLH